MLQSDKSAVAVFLVQVRPLARQNVRVDVDLHQEEERPTLNVQRSISKSEKLALLLLLLLLIEAYSDFIGCGF